MPLSINYRFLLVTSLLSGGITAALNLAISETIWHTYSLIPLWGPHGVAGYLTSFSIVAAFIITFMVTKISRRAIRQQYLYPLHWHLKSKTVIDQLPHKSFLRAFILSIIGGLIALLTVFLLNYKHFTAFYYDEYATFSIIYLFSFSAGFALMSAYRAMGDNVFK